MDPKYKPEELFLGEYSYDDWSVNTNVWCNKKKC